MTEYAEKLKDVRWQKKRLEVLNKARWKCELCKDNNTLHVHHLEYIGGREPWEYDDEDLIVLCDICHDVIHGTNLPVRLALLLKNQFRAGELYAVKMMGTHEEGSQERINYLGTLLPQSSKAINE